MITVRVGEKDSVASSGQRMTFKQRPKWREEASHAEVHGGLLDCEDSGSGHLEVRINMSQCVWAAESGGRL